MSPSSIRRGAILAFLVVLASAGPVFAERPPTPKLLVQAQKQVDGGEFEAALITLQDALASPDNSNDELAQVYWRMGEVYVYMKRDREAGEAFERLLYLAPGFQPPRLTSPHVKRTFETAAGAFREAGKEVTLKLDAVPRPTPGAPIRVTAQIRGLRRGQAARVYFRRSLSDAWLSAELVAEASTPGMYHAQLPGFPAGSGVDYYAEIAGTDRRRLVGDGSSLSPMSLQIPRSAPDAAVNPAPVAPPVVEGEGGSGAWVWALVGGVVIVGAGAAYFALTPEAATLRATVRVTP